MIVADTNLLAYLFLGGTNTAAAREVYLRDPDWATPYLWRSEMRSVIGQYIGKGELSLPDALAVQEKAEQLLRSREFLVRSDAILPLVAESGCSAYDCEFVALARQLRVPLVTSDRQVLTTFPDSTSSLTDFVGGGR